MLMNQSRVRGSILLLPQQKGTIKLVRSTDLVHFHSGNAANGANDGGSAGGNTARVAQWMRHLPMPPLLPDGNQNHSFPDAFSRHVSTGLCHAWLDAPLPPQSEKEPETHLLMVSFGLWTRSLLFPDWTEKHRKHMVSEHPTLVSPPHSWLGG